MRSELRRVLELQRAWSSANTVEMRERGDLVRTTIPNLLRSLLATDERWSVEGRDGTGRKSEIPWVRLYDRKSSPNATVGWYLVYLFDRPGNVVWLSLNQGTTTWMNGEFQPRPIAELKERVAWARKVIGGVPPGAAPSVSLAVERTELGPQYEAGNVAAFGYHISNILPAHQLQRDLHVMLARLETLLQASSDALDEPGEPPPDVAGAVAAIDEAVSPRASRLHRVSAEERRAIEQRAVVVTSSYLDELGYMVRDVGTTESYDLHATRLRKVLRVEVKGTVGDGSEVILTRNEVALHRHYHPDTMLAVVSRIQLKREPLQAMGGALRTIWPWSPDKSLLTPLAYTYQVPYE